MIIIVTNRDVRKKGTTVFKNDDDAPFGDDLQKRPDELRLATAERQDGGKWKVNLLPDTKKDPHTSETLFKKVLADMKKGRISKKWLFFVHGFNQSFRHNLDKCHALEKIYNVNVVAFSWPSNPGPALINGGPVEYGRARANALASVPALDRVLKKLSEYMGELKFDRDCDVSLNFMAYSLGNYLLEQVVRGPHHYTGGKRIFDNIVLCQPDVDAKSHHEWVPELTFGGRVYVTINERDSILKWSDVINPDRLGDTAGRAKLKDVTYFDFTGGENVKRTHGVFYEFIYPHRYSNDNIDFTRKEDLNPVITNIFGRAFNGHPAENSGGIEYVPRNNTFRLAQRDPGKLPFPFG